MTYSFDASLGTDVSLVRFHIGDNHAEGYFLEDETIQYWVTTKGSVAGAVIECIKYIITQLAVPDFKLDWMSVSNAEALKGYERLLKDKAQELGISLGLRASATISLPYRADSLQDSDEATYDTSE